MGRQKKARKSRYRTPKVDKAPAVTYSSAPSDNALAPKIRLTMVMAEIPMKIKQTMAKKLAHFAAEAKKASPAGDSFRSAGSRKEEF